MSFLFDNFLLFGGINSCFISQFYPELDHYLSLSFSFCEESYGSLAF